MYSSTTYAVNFNNTGANKTFSTHLFFYLQPEEYAVFLSIASYLYKQTIQQTYANRSRSCLNAPTTTTTMHTR